MTEAKSEDGFIAQILGWLRAGYPDGVPPKDYTPLLALLKRSLNDDQLHQVMGRLLADRPDELAREQIEQAISTVTRADATESELHQVAAKLAAGGWPLSGFAD